jgi:hypothetical protein
VGGSHRSCAHICEKAATGTDMVVPTQEAGKASLPWLEHGMQLPRVLWSDEAYRMHSNRPAALGKQAHHSSPGYAGQKQGCDTLCRHAWQACPALGAVAHNKHSAL